MKRRFAVVITVLVLAAGLSLLKGRSWYRSVREHKALNQAREFAERGDSANAALALRQVLQFNPGNVLACRWMGDLADRNHSASTLIWRKRLTELEPTVTNRLLMSECALRQEAHPYSVTGKTLREIGASGSSNVLYHSLCSQLAIKLNQLDEAETHLLAAVRLEPSNELHQVNLAALRLASGNSATAAQARARLNLARSNRILAAPILQSLIADSRAHQNLDVAEALSIELLANSNSAFSDQLVYLTILREKQSRNFTNELSSLQEKAWSNAVKAAAVCGWMNSAGLVDGAISWAQTLPRTVQTTPPLPLALAESYYLRGDWAALDEHLGRSTWEGLEALRLAWQGRALAGLQDRTGARLHWQRAVRLASANPILLPILARLSDSWEWQIETEELLWTIFNDFPGETWTAPALERLYNARGNTRGLQKLCTAMANRQPGDRVIRNNLAMYSLLLKTDLVAAHALARELHAQDPKQSSFTATYAFSLSLQGKNAEALDAIQSLKDEELAKPAIKAYAGIIMAAAGQTNQAREYLSAVAGTRLLPEEHALVEHALEEGKRAAGK